MVTKAPKSIERFSVTFNLPPNPTVFVELRDSLVFAGLEELEDLFDVGFVLVLIGERVGVQLDSEEREVVFEGETEEVEELVQVVGEHVLVQVGT